MRTHSVETVNELNDLLIGVLLGEASWQDFLDRLRLILPNGAGTLFFHDANRGEGAFSLSSGMGDDFLADYAAHYSRISPWMPHASTRPVGRAVPSAAMLARGNLRTTEFYQDFMRPQDLIEGVGVTLVREEGCNFMLSVMGAEAEEAEIGEAVAVLQEIVPQMRRAFRFYRREGMRDPAELGLPLALVTVGPGLSIRSANAAGETLLARGEALGVDRAGRLRSSEPALVEHVRMALATWSCPDLRPGPRSFVVARRDGGLPLAINVLVPSGRDERTFFRGPECHLLVEDPGARQGRGAEIFARLHGLTAAEQRVAAGLAAGLDLAAIAADAGVAVSTVRDQLKQVFAKSGVNRQAELVRQICRLDLLLDPR